MPNVKSIAGIVILGIGLVLYIVGLATPEWSTSGSNVSYGLWEKCGTVFGTHICALHELKLAKLEAADAFAVIGMLLGVCALGFAIFALVTANPNATAVAGCCFAAFGSVVIAVIIWCIAIHPDLSDYDLGYSFALSVVGGILIAIAGPLFIMASKQS